MTDVSIGLESVNEIAAPLDILETVAVLFTASVL
jgi:hypothetical protein